MGKILYVAFHVMYKVHNPLKYTKEAFNITFSKYIENASLNKCTKYQGNYEKM